MIIQYETREFRDKEGFSGDELMRLIKANDLQDYELHYFAVEHVSSPVGLSTMNPYVHVVKFRRQVK